MGHEILNALVESPRFKVTVLRRADSKDSTTFPNGVQVLTPDFESTESLAQALKGQDAVVSAVGKGALRKQFKLVDAAVQAGVKRFIPSEFGGNLRNPALRLFPTYRDKVELEDYLEEKSKETGLTYTFIYNSMFLDWGLRSGMLIDLPGRKMNLYDGGETAFSTTRLATVARAVRAVLEKADDTRNRPVYIHDISINQQKILQLARKQLPSASDSWIINHIDTEELERQARLELANGVQSSKTFYAFAMRGAFGRGYGGSFEKTDNQLLGFEGMTEDDVGQLIADIVSQT